MEGKVVLITGASSGIGKGCAIGFAKENCKLSLTGRNVEALNDTKEECIKQGIKEDEILQIQADMKIDEDIKKVIDETIKKFNRIDILINNAGIIKVGSVENITMAEYDEQMLVNTRSPFYLTKLALPNILEVKGNIVFISSITGIRAFPNVIAYNMSKAAVDHLTRSLALEVASRGVRVNAVNPGVIITEVHKRGGMNEEEYKKFLERCKTTHALGRPGEVREVVETVLFLASEKASFITGQTLPIDGGRGIMCPR